MKDFIEKYLTTIPFVQKIFFVENLRVLIQAGIAIVEALKILSTQSSNQKMKHIIESVTEKVEKGQQLSESLEEFPQFFPTVYVKMMAAGEAGGKLEESLTQITEQMKKSHELKSKIMGALIYPAVLMVAIIGIGVEMMVFVLPKLLGVFEEVNAELPLATRILIKTSNFLVAYGAWMALGIAAVIIFSSIAYKKEKVKIFTHKILNKLPIIGKITKKINLSRFASTLNSLLSSGIPIIESLKITADVLPNMPYKMAIAGSVEKIKTGSELAPLLEEHPKLFSPMVTQMIAVGERSGNTEGMLLELSKFLGGEVDDVLKNISTIIEPIIILFLGVVVAGMAIAVIMPLYSLSQNI